jgi:hypothetical protein
VREILTWAGVVVLIAVGVAFVFVEECEERTPDYGSPAATVGVDPAPGASAGTGVGTGMGADPSTGVGTGSGAGTAPSGGTSTGTGSGTGAGAPAAVVPAAPPPAAEPPRPIRQPEVIRPGAAFVVTRRGEVMPAGTAPAAGDNLRVNVIVPEGETHYASLVALSDGAASILLGDPSSPADPHAARGPFRFPGTLSLRPGGGLVRLIVVVREDRFTVAELLREAETAARRGGTPEGTVAELSVDLGR